MIQGARVLTTAALAAACLSLIAPHGGSTFASEQAPAQAERNAPAPPQVVSPDVLSDRRVAFRIYAPQARAIRLAASDIPGVGQTTQLTKNAEDVWEATVGPLEAGAYRYHFNVDGVATIDPRNPSMSESNNNVWSLVYVAGSDLFDTKDVPRGAVAKVTYNSTSLGKFRRMHVYTPPGYESGNGRYPVFYLLHGAGDNDEAWSSVGRAGFILDNLIAAKKARPMIVVMPAGHTSRGPGSPIGRAATEEFVDDFVHDVMPYVEKHYRVLTDRASTAIAGLSMGGGHTLNVAVPRLERFAYIGVYSSGLLGSFPLPDPPAGRGPAPAAAAPSGAAAPPPTAAEWETMHEAKLGDPALKAGLRLLWFATGKDDRLIRTTQGTVDLFKKHGFAPVFKESPGGHTWMNWRNYLAEFAPLLFQSGGAVAQSQTPNPADVEMMMAALPDKAPATPKRPRKVLVLARAAGYVHASIPLAARTVEEMGKKTGAWSTTTTYDAADINEQNLKQYDAIFLASTTGAFLDDPNDQAATAARRKALLDFVRGGKGLAGIHAATDSYHRSGPARESGADTEVGTWPEFNRLIGGFFKFHWNDGQVITVKIEEPNHPLNAMFGGQPFQVIDETYTFGRQVYSRENVRVLTSIDYAKMSAADKAKERYPRADGDYALSWIRREGQGRVFYEAHGHNPKVYAMRPILEHVLAGIQYVLGDLAADDRPSLTASARW